MNTCTTEKEYISIIASQAQSACSRLKTMLPSVIIGQACLETGYGIPSYWDNPQIEALMRYNNLLGMKSSLLNASWSDKTVWPGKSLTKQTPEVYNGRKVTITDNFRIYESVEQCFSDYILFLLYASNNGKGGTPKYGRAVTDIKDPETLIKTINAKGYATNPNYWQSVMKIINKHDLTQYDVEPDYKPAEEVDMAGKTEAIKIIDITSKNTPPRTGNTRQALVFHFLGVAGADNPYLYGGGYGGQWYIARNGDIYHAVKPGGTVWAVGSGGWGLKGTKWNNSNTESVEMGCECDGDKNSIYDKKWWFHMATQESAVKLARYWLEMRGYGVSEKTVNERILVHNTITNKPCPAPWLHGAGYKSGREKGQVNWSFDEFKRKIWKGYTGRTVVEGGSPSGATKIEERNYLKKGDKGNVVQIMQEKLIACGYDCGKSGADGDFGNATLAAVKAFQADAGLTVDGYYGEKSKAALEALYNKKKEASAGQAEEPASGSDPGGAAALEEVRASVEPKEKDPGVAGTYRVTTPLNLRNGPGTGEKVLKLMDTGTKVHCYGYLTTVGSVKWLFVQTTINGNVYTGFCCRTYLARI